MNLIQLTTGVFVNLDNVTLIEEVVIDPNIPGGLCRSQFIRDRTYDKGSVLLFTGREPITLTGDNAKVVKALLDESRDT